MARTSSSSFDPLKVSENNIYHFLVTQWQHQNQLSWSRLNVMLALETAILAGSYYVKPWWIGCALLLVGTMVGYILYRLMRRDWHVRDYHLILLDKVHKDIIFDQDKTGKDCEIRMIPEDERFLSNGQKLLRLLFTILLLTNVGAFAFIFHESVCVSDLPETKVQSTNLLRK